MKTRPKQTPITIDFSIRGIPCNLRINDYDFYTPAKYSGYPDDWEPSCGGYGDWQLFDKNGKRMVELEKNLTYREQLLVNHFIFELMES